MVRSIVGVVVCLLVTGAPAGAQPEPKAGLTMGYPAAIGILWQVSERVAMRPDFNISQTSNTSGSDASAVTGDSWAFGFGMSVLLYVGRIDNLRTYASPRFAYSHSSNSTTAPTLSNPTSKTDANLYQVAGSFGVQYALHRRFSIYGEAGLQYASSDATFTSGSSASGRTTAHSWGTRTALGVVIYFD